MLDREKPSGLRWQCWGVQKKDCMRGICGLNPPIRTVGVQALCFRKAVGFCELLKAKPNVIDVRDIRPRGLFFALGGDRSETRRYSLWVRHRTRNILKKVRGGNRKETGQNQIPSLTKGLTPGRGPPSKAGRGGSFDGRLVREPAKMV